MFSKLISVAAIAIAYALLGQVSPEPVAAHQTVSSSDGQTDDRIHELVTDYHVAMHARKFGKALNAAEQIKLSADNREGAAVVLAMRASALLGLKREKQAVALIDEAERTAPQVAAVNTTLLLGALLTDHWDVAANALDRLIARAPDAVRDIDWELMRFFLRSEPKDQEVKNEDRRVALARLAYGGNTETGDYLAKGAVDILVKRGDLAGARDLIRFIDEPQIVENLLIQKRFVSLWPEIEAKAGQHLTKVRVSSASSAERYYAEQPDDPERLQLLANALRHAGRLDDAIALRAALPTDITGMSAADERLGWAVNNVALALHEAGRADEADQLFALLNDAPMPVEGWRVSMKINRLQLLVADGKFEQALPLIEPTAKVQGSPYADQLVRRLRYCTIYALGRTAEAARLLPELLAHSKDAVSATIDGLLCAGQVDKAEKLALASLEDEDFHEAFIRELQPKQLTSERPAIWTKGWQELRRRPAISARFNQIGRDMPEHFLPASRN